MKNRTEVIKIYTETDWRIKRLDTIGKTAQTEGLVPALHSTYRTDRALGAC